jgi:hypothetical protein
MSNNKTNEDFDDFFYTTWDYVSDKVVDDNFWEDNQELIKSITFDLYNFKDKSNITEKQVGKILESIFFNLIRQGVRIRGGR